MKSFLIFCEGITDQIFIADCLELFYNIQCERKKKSKTEVDVVFNGNSQIVNVGGCSRISDPIYTSMFEDNFELGGINLVVFDADITGQTNGNKGFKACGHKLEELKKANGLSFSHFIWPNNFDDGIFEDLLIKLVPNNRSSILNCIVNHQDCLRGLQLENLRYAELKEIINFYLYTSNSPSEPGKRNYKDGIIWDLDTSLAIGLKRFKEFLDPFFT